MAVQSLRGTGGEEEEVTLPAAPVTTRATWGQRPGGGPKTSTGVLDVQAIETRYKGYRFRSRLEARWAVFFDALGIKWEYEHEGFDLDGVWYLPDFYFPEGDYFVEIKPGRQPDEAETEKWVRLSRHRPIAVMLGTPELPRVNGWRGSWALMFTTKMVHAPNGKTALRELSPGGKGINFYPSFPYGDEPEQAWADKHLVLFNEDGKALPPRLSLLRHWCWHERNDGSFLLWPVPANEPVIVDGRWTGELSDPLQTGVKRIDSPRLRAAYDAARGARFEHGESPRVR